MAFAWRDYVDEPGNAALWIGFAFSITATVVFLFMAYIRHHNVHGKFLFSIATLMTAIMTLAYLVMALGDSEIPDQKDDRAFQWIRYADQAVSIPLQILALGLLASVHPAELFLSISAALIMIGAGFAGAISPGDNSAWPLYAFAFVGVAVIVVSLFSTWRSSAYKVHVEVGRLFDFLSIMSTVLWIGYGIIWGSAQGGRKMTVDEETITYTAFDIMARVAFGCILLFSSSAISRYGTFRALGFMSTEHIPTPQRVRKVKAPAVPKPAPVPKPTPAAKVVAPVAAKVAAPAPAPAPAKGVVAAAPAPALAKGGVAASPAAAPLPANIQSAINTANTAMAAVAAANTVKGVAGAAPAPAKGGVAASPAAAPLPANIQSAIDTANTAMAAVAAANTANAATAAVTAAKK